MNKIEAVKLRTLDNEEHFQFMTGFDSLITCHPTAIMGSEVIYGIFKNTLMAEDLAYRIEQGSSAAQTLDRLDKLRDRTWNAIRLRVKATLQSPFKGEADSALIIFKIINRYGDVCSFTYSEQCLAIENITNDLLFPAIGLHAENIGISDWIKELKYQNKKFTDTFNTINSEFVGRESTDVKAVRTLIDPVYHQMIARINAMIILEFASPEIMEFAQKLNELIKYYYNPLIDGKTRRDVDKKKEV